MSNYIKSTDFAVKDGLVSGNPLKIVSGTEIDDEFNALQTAVNTKADLNSPTFTGTPQGPTASTGTATTQLATCQFVTNSPAFAGVPTAPTASAGTNTTQLATCQFVTSAVLAGVTGGTADVDVNSMVVGTAGLYHGGNQTGWHVYQSGTSLYWAYNGTVRMRLESTGRLYAENDIGAFVSL